jgi:hypothetical protein
MEQKASDLKSGFLFIKHAEDKKGNIIKNTLVQKIGNQISYFGTTYWDKADELKGEFDQVIPQSHEKNKKGK